MSIDAYKIAVQIALTENVTRGLLALSSHFKRADMDAAALQKRLDHIGKMTLGGGLLVGAGALGIKMLQGPLDAAKKYQAEMARLEAQGVGDAALIQADKYAKAQKIMGASSADTLKMLAETNSVLRDMHHAEAVTPMLLKMKFGMETVMSNKGHGGGHGERAERMFMDALKVGELRGATSDPLTGKFSAERFKETMDFMTRAYTASGGLVKPTEYLNMIKTGGIAAKSLSDQSFYFGLMHMAQEQGGSRTGTGLMSAFQNMYMGRTTQQVAEEMNKNGLLQKDKLHYGKTGHITKIDAGALKDADLFRTDQFKYMNEVMLPMLRANGVQDGEAMKMQIAKLFSNRVGGSQWVTMYQERGNIQKHIDAAKHALGVDDLAKVGEKTHAGQLRNYQARLESLQIVLGEKILPTVIRGLELLGSAIERVTDFAKAHPTLTNLAVKGFALLSVFAVVAGSVLIVKAAFTALGLVLGGSAIVGGLLRIAPVLGVLGAIPYSAIALGIGGVVAAIWGASKLADAITNTKNGKRAQVQVQQNELARIERQISGYGGNLNDQRAKGLINQRDKINAALGYGHYSNEGRNFVRPAQSQTIQVDNKIVIDGRQIAAVVTTHQAREAARPMAGSSYFDPIMHPMPFGMNRPRGGQ